MRAFSHPHRVARALVAGAALLALIGAGVWAWQIARKAEALLLSLDRIESELGAADPARWPAICAEAERASAAAATLRATAAPLLALGPVLSPLPRLGPQLAAAGPLLAAAEPLGAAARATCAELPALLAPLPPGGTAPTELTGRLAAARPGLAAVSVQLQRAAAGLAAVPRTGLDPALAGRLDRASSLLARARAGLELALAAPALLGADAPRTYLVVVQNPDEIRPTGGFISAAGLLRLEGGRVAGLELRDSATLDSATAAYPLAPEPMRRYMLEEPMGPGLWLFRDANWSPDFPSSARQMLALYALGQGQQAEGVIALTPEAVRLALAALGPVRVAGSSQPVAADSLDQALRAAYDDALEQGRPEERKSFVSQLGTALIDRAAASDTAALFALARAAETALDRRAAQIYLPESDPAAALLAARGWDGAVRPGAYDYLMAVSANVGYNKVGPSIAQELRYRVDLSGAPRAELTVMHINRSPEAPGCDPRGALRSSYGELTTGCFWNYLRVLVPGEAILADTEVVPVPDSWLLGGDGDGGRVYSEPGPSGTRVYGALVVVPSADRLATSFSYELPPGVVRAAGGLSRYSLRIQRQPGVAQRAVVQVLLPAGADLLEAAPAPQSRDGQRFTFELSLESDRALELAYRVP